MILRCCEHLTVSDSKMSAGREARASEPSHQFFTVVKGMLWVVVGTSPWESGSGFLSRLWHSLVLSYQGRQGHFLEGWFLRVHMPSPTPTASARTQGMAGGLGHCLKHT